MKGLLTTCLEHCSERSDNDNFTDNNKGVVLRVLIRAMIREKQGDKEFISDKKDSRFVHEEGRNSQADQRATDLLIRAYQQR